MKKFRYGTLEQYAIVPLSAVGICSTEYSQTMERHIFWP